MIDSEASERRSGGRGEGRPALDDQNRAAAGLRPAHNGAPPKQPSGARRRLGIAGDGEIPTAATETVTAGPAGRPRPDDGARGMG